MDVVFRTYGRVEDVVLMTKNSRNGQVAAFVRYEDVRSAKKAVAAMEQGYEIRPGEGNINVRFAEEGGARNKGDAGSGKADDGRGGRADDGRRRGDERHRPY